MIDVAVRLALVTNSINGLKPRDVANHALLGFFAGLCLTCVVGTSIEVWMSS